MNESVGTRATIMAGFDDGAWSLPGDPAAIARCLPSSERKVIKRKTHTAGAHAAGDLADTNIISLIIAV